MILLCWLLSITDMKRRDFIRGWGFYGRKNVYRTGGDEFAVLTIDITAEKFEENRDKIVEILAQEKGPNISIGFEWCSSASDLKWCVKKADDMMYKNKQSYYTKHDRRKRHI